MTRRLCGLVALATGLSCTAQVEPDPRALSQQAVSQRVADSVATAEPSIGSVAPAVQSASSAVPVRPPPPAALVASIATKPYVEESCVKAPTTELPTALRCRYEVMGLAAEIVVANPTAEQVVDWAVDAASYAEPLEAIRLSHPEVWLRGVKVFVRHVKYQSSRIFPISGEVIEDLGKGPTRYTFDRGVVTPCERGNCRCRVNSVLPRVYCRFEEAQGGDSKRCLERYEGPAGDEAWRNACRDNHAKALSTRHNDNFRARAFVVGQRLKERCSAGCEPERLITMLEKELGLP